MSRSARICSPCRGPVGLDAKSSPSIPWCPSQPGAGTGWDHRQSPQGTWSSRETQQTWTWTRADGDGEQSPANLSSDRWPSHWPGREAGAVLAASNCSHSSLFLLNLSQRAPVFPSPQLHRGCDACGGWGTTGLLNIPSPSPGHGKTFLTQEHKLKEIKQPQKINLFSTIFSFFLSLFSLFGILLTFSGTGE